MTVVTESQPTGRDGIATYSDKHPGEAWERVKHETHHEALFALLVAAHGVGLAGIIRRGEAELASMGTFKPFIVVANPELVGEHWVIKKTLSDSGQVAYDAMKAGILWDYQNKVPDYEATMAYYRAMMAKGQIEMRFVDLLTETKTEELRELRNELVYFKLRGQRRQQRGQEERDQQHADRAFNQRETRTPCAV